MTEEEKRRESAPVYGGSWDASIGEAFEAVTGRGPFRYSLDGDALYRQYRDRYLVNARRSMKDTMGQAAALTGGYGSSYAQGAGQQAYDETLRGLTDLVPALERRAYERWRDEGDALMQRYTMLSDLGAADQKTRQDARDWDFKQQQYADEVARYADSQRQQAYANLSAAILKSGYEPDDGELSSAGMSREQAAALRQAWMASDPNAAYMRGFLSADEYFLLTGQPAPGTAAGTGGGYSGKSSAKKTPADKLKAAAEKMQMGGASNAEVNSFLLHSFESYGATAADVKSIRSDLGTTVVRRK